MNFNTLTFGLFMPAVFVLYWLLPGRTPRARNVLLLAASYLFYGWWDVRFLGLLILSTLISYMCALPHKHRRVFATVAVVANLLILCVFKYFNFFSDNLKRLIETFGAQIDWFTIDVLLPVGISFYTFQAVSYSVDVYKGRTAPTRDAVAFAVFISFFPQLVAGPIERSTQLLPQFLQPRRWNYAGAVLGMRQILWGLFKKCVVADGAGFWVDMIYKQNIWHANISSSVMCVLGVTGFALQIYGDFSGYSDIAKGSARLLGIRLMDNFLYPFFSRNAIELWHRWHRSLMQWFTEYVYIPLGGSRRGNRYINVMIVFVLSGLWHGADWTFVAWGVLCGLWYIASVKCGAKRYRPFTSPEPSRRDLPAIAATFIMFVVVFIFFRARDMHEAMLMYHAVWIAGVPAAALLVAASWIISRTVFDIRRMLGICLILLLASVVSVPRMVLPALLSVVSYIAGAVVLYAEWRGRRHTFALENMPRRRWVRYAIYTVLYLLIFTSSMGNDGDFIYFRF